MKNPYRRLIEACSVTHADFVKRSGVSKPGLHLVLNGQLSPLSDRMRIALGKLCHESGVDARAILEDEYGTRELTTAYERWRRLDRASVDVKWPDIHEAHECDEVTGPLFWFVKESLGTPSAFGKALHIHTGQLHRYITGQNDSVRDELTEAILGAGHGSEDVAYLLLEQDRWIERLDA